MRNNQDGYINGTLVSLIAAVSLLVGALSFGAWAFAGRQDYKQNSDRKAAVVAAEAVKAAEAADAAKYAEAAKNPLKTYVGPSAYGAITVQYPKTWSAYVLEDGNSNIPLNDYFHPDVVPRVEGDDTYSLRIKIEQRAYDTVVATYKASVDTKKLTASAYTLPKVPNVVGVRMDGQITTKVQGSIIILPLRNLTLEIWTESNSFLPDFNNIILPNLTFSP